MLGLAALAGAAMARWRNHADIAKEQNSLDPMSSPSRVSNITENAGVPGKVHPDVNQEEDLLEDAGVYYSTPRPSFFLADETGQVTDLGLEESGVSLGKKEEIQAALDIARASILASMKKRVQPDERNSDAAKGIRAYLIPAQMGVREEILGKLEADLTRICGAEKGPLLTQALHPGNRFGYFGRQSISVRIYGGSGDQGQKADFFSFDPMSGQKVLSHAVTDAEQFRTYFGDAIEW